MRTADRPGQPSTTALPQLAPIPNGDLDDVRADVLAVPLASPAAGEAGPEPRAGVAEVVARYGVDLAEVCAQESFTGSAGQVLAVPVAALRDRGSQDGAHDGTHDGSGTLPRRLLLVGVGDGSRRSYRRAGAGLARATRGVQSLAATVVSGQPADVARGFCEGLLLASYAPPRQGLSEGPKPAVQQVQLLGCRHTAAVESARVAALATWRVRDLSNTPSSTKDPAWMAEQARALAAQVPGVEVEVLDAAALRERGFGGVLAVGAGSASEPCLVSVSWSPPARTARTRHVVLVGKGITYDTGGLSIKPREAMVPMKTDMAGSAVVLATVLAAASAGVPHRLTALLPLAENAFGASSYRPGDVVTIFGGTTVEVVNTDAEGRMVLADALAYADHELQPDVLVDVATLTGAATLGLGRRHAAMYTADDRLAAGLEAAAERTGERVWRMPLVEDYRPALDSDVADLCHVVKDRRISGGSIMAALFLREFVGARRWVHLDIAGPGRAERDEHEVTKGASGFGARLLLDWLASLR